MSKSTPVTKAVILAAGFGTRFLPASKAVPKVMFPVIDKPIIQIIVEEVVKAGITDITFVLSPFTLAIRQHFESFPALNKFLEKSGKVKEIEELKRIEGMANYSFCLQSQGVREGKDRHGIGVGIYSAKELIGNQPFLMLFADEFFFCHPPWIVQLVEAYKKYGGNILGCMRTSLPEHGNRYGFVTGEKINDNVVRVTDLIEKPGIGKAPSDIASMTGMVFQPEVFGAIVEIEKELEENKELYHTYAIKNMLKKEMPFYAIVYQNSRYIDTGDRYWYLKNLVELGMEYPAFGEEFKVWLRGLKV